AVRPDGEGAAASDCARPRPAAARRERAGMSTVEIPQPRELEIVERSGNQMVVSMGPQHPSTHGVLQVITEIEGEVISRSSPEIGYLHTGIEKSAENLFWTQASTVIERMDYLSPISNALCYYLAVEKLL